MSSMKRRLINAGLDALYFTGAHRLLQPVAGGAGAILMLHHVRPSRPQPFQPNRSLEVTPQFLRSVIERLARSGFEFVSLDEMRRRLTESRLQQRFVCVTFDDGYRDNKTWAYPILKERSVPFAIYVTTSFLDRTGVPWWSVLESVIDANDSIVLPMPGRDYGFGCASTQEKYAVYDQVSSLIHSLPSDQDMFAAVRALAARHGVDVAGLCDASCMTWDELAELASDPLVTVGAHTVNHVNLARASEATARSELGLAKSKLESMLGKPTLHLAYPYGGPQAAGPREYALAAELGYATAVTTRPGVLAADHRTKLTALPRVELGGKWKHPRNVDVLVSGAAYALQERLSRLTGALAWVCCVPAQAVTTP